MRVNVNWRRLLPALLIGFIIIFGIGKAASFIINKQKNKTLNKEEQAKVFEANKNIVKNLTSNIVVQPYVNVVINDEKENEVVAHYSRSRDQIYKYSKINNNISNKYLYTSKGVAYYYIPSYNGKPCWLQTDTIDITPLQIIPPLNPDAAIAIKTEDPKVRTAKFAGEVPGTDGQYFSGTLKIESGILLTEFTAINDTKNKKMKGKITYDEFKDFPNPEPYCLK